MQCVCRRMMRRACAGCRQLHYDGGVSVAEGIAGMNSLSRTYGTEGERKIHASLCELTEWHEIIQSRPLSLCLRWESKQPIGRISYRVAKVYGCRYYMCNQLNSAFQVLRERKEVFVASMDAMMMWKIGSWCGCVSQSAVLTEEESSRRRGKRNFRWWGNAHLRYTAERHFLSTQN